MLKKTIDPIIGSSESGDALIVLGTVVKYRVFGILVYEKTLRTPRAYGVNSEFEWCYRI